MATVAQYLFKIFLCT